MKFIDMWVHEDYRRQGYQAFAVFEDFFEVKGYHHIGYRKDIGAS